MNVDQQPFPKDGNCLGAGMLESLRRVRRRRDVPSLPFAIMNMNHPPGEMFPVLHSNRTPRWFDAHRHEPYVVQLAYRMQCGFGHYLLLVVDPTTGALLFDPDGNAGMFHMERYLKRALPYLHVPFGGTLARHLGMRTRNVNVGGEDCSVWVAFVYYLFARGGLRGLRATFTTPPSVLQGRLDDFRSRVLG